MKDSQLAVSVYTLNIKYIKADNERFSTAQSDYGGVD